jgi:hypothetical protein
MTIVHLQAYIFLHCYGKSFAPFLLLFSLTIRCTARMLQSELAKDGNIDPAIMAQLCTVFEGGKRLCLLRSNSANTYEHVLKPNHLESDQAPQRKNFLRYKNLNGFPKTPTIYRSSIVRRCHRIFW